MSVCYSLLYYGRSVGLVGYPEPYRSVLHTKNGRAYRRVRQCLAWRASRDKNGYVHGTVLMTGYVRRVPLGFDTVFPLLHPRPREA